MSACSLLAIILVQANIICNYVTGSSGCERCVTGLDKWVACWRSEGLYPELCMGVLCVLLQRLVAYLGKGWRVAVGEWCGRTGLLSLWGKEGLWRWGVVQPYRTAESKGQQNKILNERFFFCAQKILNY